jgi:hypothetical protein
MTAIAADYLPAECIKAQGKELRLICPEETDEMIEDLSNYEDGQWVGPHGRALNAIKAAMPAVEFESLKFNTWYCLRSIQEWTPSHELVLNNVD